MISKVYFALLISALTACSSNLELHMLNISRGTINDVQVVYFGSPVHVDKINNEKQINLLLKPSGETDIKIRYRFEESKPVICNLNRYVEPGYRGNIVVKISKDKCYVSEAGLTVF